MARARIEANASQVDSLSVTFGDPVLLSNDDEGDEDTYTWTIIDKPEGSSAALSNTAIENPQFTTDVEGTYLIRLVVDIGTGSEAIDYCAIYVLRALDNERIPAAAETTEASSVKGWALATNRNMARALDQLALGGPIIVAYTPGGFAAGSIVRLSGLSEVPGGQEIPVISAATGSEAAVRGLLGMVVDGVISGEYSAGAYLLVQIFGIHPSTFSGAATAGAPVYVSDAGAPALTPGTRPRIIGRVAAASGGVTYRVFVDGQDARFAFWPRMTHPMDFYVPVEGWSISGEGSAPGPYGHGTTSASVDPMFAPLRVEAGEILHSVVLDLKQGSTSALITAKLIKGTSAGGSESDVMTSPGTNGAFQWTPTFTGTLTLPALCSPNEKFWLSCSSSGANGTSRMISGVTANCRPAT
jgi:hypothetical protein